MLSEKLVRLAARNRARIRQYSVDPRELPLTAHLYPTEPQFVRTIPERGIGLRLQKKRDNGTDEPKRQTSGNFPRDRRTKDNDKYTLERGHRHYLQESNPVEYI